MIKKHRTLTKIAAWFFATIMSVSTIAHPASAQFFLDYTQNDIQTYDPRSCLTSGESDTSLKGSENQQKAYNYFVEKGLTPIQSAAIVGNLMQESGVNPKAVNPSSGAYGIAQWLGGRKTGLENFANKHNKPINDLALQLDWLWHEVTEGAEQASLRALKNETTLATNTSAGTGGAVESWERNFERAGEHEKNYPRRYKFAKSVLDKYGKDNNATVPATSESAGFCTCETGKVVLLDPGHSKDRVAETDPKSGIKAEDYENTPEMQEVWEVSQKASDMLKESGFRVIMTKNNANDSVGLLRRAQIANQIKPDIAVSIHNDHGQNFNDMKWVTPQEVGKYRKTGDNRKAFEDEDVAKKSQEYAKAIQSARKSAEGGNVEIRGLEFPEGRGLPATGNIAIVQLFSKVPWVYNEVGGKGWNKENADKYAKGIANGIKAAIGASGAQSANAGCGVGNGDASQMAMNYAWPDFHEAPYPKQKPEYTEATRNAQKAGRYIGGCNGNDCGAFVTRVMQDSRADPKYNNTSAGKGPVTSQEAYMKANSDKYKSLGQVSSPSELKNYGFGIAISNGQDHTFMYIGKQPGFETDRASASYDGDSCQTGDAARAPMAGMESFSGNRWYVLK